MDDRARRRAIRQLNQKFEQAQLQQFDNYVGSLMDVRSPGNYKWLQQVYPDYVARQLYNPFFFHLSNVANAPRELIKYLIDLLRSVPDIMRAQFDS